MTGNNGSSVSDDDVDNGQVRLLSPIFDIANYNEPRLSVQTWFVNVGGVGAPDDELVLKIFNGDSTIVMESISLSNPNWTARDYRIKDYIVPSSTMRFIVETADLQGSGHIVEAGIDGFEVYENQPNGTVQSDDFMPQFKVYPNPFSDNITIEYELKQSDAILEIFNMVGQKVETRTLNNANGFIQVGDNLEAGVYFVRIIQEGQASTRQIIKVNR